MKIELPFTFRVCAAVLALVGADALLLAAQPANPNTNKAAGAVLDYFCELSACQDGPRILSGQFTDFGNGANLRMIEQVHEQTGVWPALIGVDYADFGRGSVTTKVPNEVAIQYWKHGGLVHVMAHMYNPANPRGGGLRDKGVNLEELPPQLFRRTDGSSE